MHAHSTHYFKSMLEINMKYVSIHETAIPYHDKMTVIYGLGVFKMYT